jgi:hypothetical protein
MHRLYLIITKSFFVLILSSLLIPSNIAVQAETNPQGTSALCYSLDVVFLIDQSSSMSGGFSASDPTQQRKFAVQSAIDYLADTALDKCKNANHRIAVVSFGSVAQTDLEYGEIGPETIQEAIDIRNRLKKKVDVYDLGDTQPLKAFKKASEIFSSNLTTATVSKEAGLRKRVIIFITDGIPYPTQNGWLRYIQDLKKAVVDNELPFNPVLLEQEKCLEELTVRYSELTKAPDEERNTCLSKYPAAESEFNSSTYIFGLFLRSNDAYTAQYIDAWNEIFESHAGKSIILSKNRQDIPSTIRNLISRLAAVEVSVVKCGTFAVNPYVKRAILTFFKLDPELQVTLDYQDSKGITHSMTGGKQGPDGGFNFGEPPTFDGANERYVINDPYPGIWNLSADNCDGLDAYYDPVQVKPGAYQPNLPAEIPQYELPPYSDIYQPFYLDYQIKDADGRVVPEADDPAFKISINAKVTKPDGSVESYPMEYKNKEQLFRTTSPIKIPVTGIYSIDLSGTYLSHPGDVTVSTTNYSQVFTEQKTLFEEKGIEFKVHPVTPFSLEIIDPKPNEKLGTVHKTIMNGWPLPISPISFLVKFNDQVGQQLKLADILNDPTNPLEGIIEGGGKTSEPAKFTIDPSDPTLFHGTIENFDYIGSQVLKVKLISGFNEYYRPLQREFEVTIIREDDLFTMASTYRSILIGLILILFLWILSWFLGLKNKLSGHLLIKMNGAVVRVLRLANGRNSAYFGLSFWRKRVQTCILSLKVYGAKNLNPGRKTASDDDINETLPGSIRVEGKVNSNEGGIPRKIKFKLTLMSGMDLPLCDEPNCSIEYLDKKADIPAEYNEMAEFTPGGINILPTTLFLTLLGIITWFLVVMLF